MSIPVELNSVLSEVNEIKSLYEELRMNVIKMNLISEEKEMATTEEEWEHFHESEFILMIENSRLYRKLTEAIAKEPRTDKNEFFLRRMKKLADELSSTDYIEL